MGISFFKEEYNPDVYCGVDSTDIKVIHLAIQNGNKLKIDSNGRVFDESGRWIADGMKREIAKRLSKAQELEKSTWLLRFNVINYI